MPRNPEDSIIYGSLPRRMGANTDPNAGGDAGMSESDLLDYFNQMYQQDPEKFMSGVGSNGEVTYGGLPYKIQDGKVVEGGSIFDRHSWLMPALIAGGMFAAPVVAGAMAGSGGAAAGAGGAASGSGTAAGAGTAAGLGHAALTGAELGAAQGAIRGGIQGGVGGALRGAAMGGLTGAAGGAVAGGLLPTVGSPLLNSALQGGVRGAVGAGVAGQNPLMGAATGAGTGVVSGLMPKGGTINTMMSGAAKGGTASAIQGRNPITGAAQGAIGGALNPTAATGGNMPFSYDPWSDPSNYDDNGQFIGADSYDDNGNYIGGGDEPSYGVGQNDAGVANQPTLEQLGANKSQISQLLQPTTQSAAGKLLQQLLAGQKGSGLADAASLFGKYAGTQAANRGTAGDMTANYDRLRLAAQQDQRLQESDAMKKLAQSNYILGGGSKFNPSAMGLPDFGFGPTAPSASQRTAASTLQNEMLKRVQPGNNFQPTDVTKFTNPGTSENIANWIALGLGGVGAYQALRNKPPVVVMDGPGTGGIGGNLPRNESGW